MRRLLLVPVAAALCAGSLAVPVAASADTPAPAPVFTLTAVRGSGAQVTIDGQYAAWDATQGAYVRSAAHVGLEIPDLYDHAAGGGPLWTGFADAVPTDAHGVFHTVVRIFPTTQLRAYDADTTDVTTAAVSAAVHLTRGGRMPTEVYGLAAYQRRKTRAVTVSGFARADVALSTSGAIEMQEDLHSKVTIQKREHGHWRTKARFRSRKVAGLFEHGFRAAYGSVWRVRIARTRTTAQHTSSAIASSDANVGY